MQLYSLGYLHIGEIVDYIDIYYAKTKFTQINIDHICSISPLHDISPRNTSSILTSPEIKYSTIKMACGTTYWIDRSSYEFLQEYLRHKREDYANK